MIHGKTLADDRLCPARDGIVTVLLDWVTCPECRAKLAATGKG